MDYKFIEGQQGKNGLEYLGFRFDGNRVYLRDSTLSAFHRKITFSTRRAASALVARYPGKDFDFLIKSFDEAAFIQRFGRVEDFDNSPDYRTWTFWTYARRAAGVFGSRGMPILRQLRQHRRVIKRLIKTEIRGALVRKKEKSKATL